MDCLEHLLHEERDIARKAIAKVKELEERLQNAIVPKFNVGQKVWYIGSRRDDLCVFFFVVDEISIKVNEQGYRIFYEEHGYLGISEDTLFATQAEAEKALAEAEKALAERGAK